MMTSGSPNTLYGPQDQDPDGYRYSSIPGDRHIRILELHPGAGNEPLSGTFSVVSLDDLTTTDFKALSYVWGGPGEHEHEDKIRLGGGQSLRIWPNLRDALYHLRHQSTAPRRLWIDALCINRCDSYERSFQVSLMADIYSRCPSVVVWLGMPGPHSQLGLEFLSFLCHSKAPVDDGDEPPWNRLRGQNIVAALRDILGRAYFSRLWIVQEAALAGHIRMQVGREYMEWSAGRGGAAQQTRRFLARIKLAELSPSWQHSSVLHGADLRPMRELLEQSLAAEARRNGTVVVPSLLDVVHSIRQKNVFDPRDRIYGVMSLVTPAEVADLVPDYNLTWEETYRRFFDLVEGQVLRDPEITVEEVMGKTID